MIKYITVRRTSDTNTSPKVTGKVRRSIGSPKNFKKSSKKCLTIWHFGGKINKLSAARLRRYRTLKIEQYRKLVTEPIFVLENHVKQFQTK